MNSIFKLVLALLLAFAAAAGNYFWLSRVKNQGFTAIQLTSKKGEGEDFKGDDFEKVIIPSRVPDLKETFLSWDNRKLLVGTPAPKDFKKGELLLHQDLRFSKPNWKALGPFRLLSVGERIRNSTGDRFSEGRGNSTVTIEVELEADGNYDEKTLRLLDIIAAVSSKESERRIIAVQIDPVKDNVVAEGVVGSSVQDFDMQQDEYENSAMVLPENSRAIMIPLSGVQSIPEVLVRGDSISFVVNWYDEIADTTTKESTSP